MYAKIKQKVITLAPPENGAAYQRLLGGRAFLHDQVPNGGGQHQQVDIIDVGRRLNDLAALVTTNFVGRAELAQAIALSLAIGEHLFVYGEPGTAKSSVLRLFAEGIGGNFWRIVMNPDLPRDEILGALDPQALAQGQWLRKWAGLATADVAFLDEIWKASPQVVNILLDGLEERRVSSGGQDSHIPLLSAMSASNEIPSHDESNAAYDRFLIRVVTNYVTDMGDFRKLMTASAGAQPVTTVIQSDEIRLLAAASEVLALNPPSEVMETLVSVRRHFNGAGISDRRWRKYLKAACGACLLRGSVSPLPIDLKVGQWILWSQADERPEAVKAVFALCDPAAGEVLTLEKTLADLEGAIKQYKAEKEDSKKNALFVMTTKNASRLRIACQKLLDSGSAIDYVYRLQDIQAKAQDVVDAMGKIL